MLPGGIVATGPAKRYAGRITPYVVLTCIVAASGGALFGYDNGVTGGVVAMPDFLQKFFPSVLADVEADGQNGNPYCKYNSQPLQWFTSSLFIAGVFAALPAGYTTRKYGRKKTMLIAGLLFDLGVIITCAAFNLAMLIIGRIFLGIAVAFASVAVTLYNSEMAPAHIRGRLNQIFQVVLTLGIVLAQAINIGTQHIPGYGWRISLMFAGVPALVLTLGGLLLPDTPNSLIERGHEDQGKQVLRDIRGVDNVEEEFQDIKAACERAALVVNPWRTIFKPSYAPQLFVAITATLFQQWTGINTIIFYAPQLFITLGASQSAALAATIVTGVVNHLATYVSLWAADEFGRRVLFIEGGIQMSLALVVIGITLAATGGEIWAAWFVLALMCVYISAYAWSWGPLGWLYSSEVQPLETRSAGQSITTLVNLMFSFVIGQTYLSMLCSMRWGLFFFFAGMCVLMTITVYGFYPETKGLGIEETPQVFQKHWFWKRFTRRPDRAKDVQLLSVNGVARGRSGLKEKSPGADVEAANGASTANGAAPMVQLDRESVAGLRQEKVPLSDDPFWDGA
ncbi:hypothetical protein WJX75_000080 [Coccomyxa subellipsoidea]|uniref:Major facilitator superfamily (MFS) profile domain-containing protein n=1 Tax=Coccomyxa subellipsoidea TaxID=248742 RepID=A0ABR2YFT8_9CHLO